MIVDRSVEGPHNCRFDGTIIYDASDNITLKAGGVFTTRYLEGVWYGIENINSGACLYENHKKQYMKFLNDTLKEDRIVNSDNFELEKLYIPKSYNIKENIYDFYRDILNPPTDLKYYLLYELKKVYVFDNHMPPHEEWIIYLNSETWNDTRIIYEAIDQEGRTWSWTKRSQWENIRANAVNNFFVKYPNGNMISSGGWEIHFPNNQIVKYNGDSQIDLGKGIIVIHRNAFNAFFDLSKRDKFYLTKNEVREVLFKSFYYEMPSNEVEGIIKEQLCPYLENNGNDYTITILYIAPSGSWNTLGEYKDGKFFSEYEKGQAKKEAEKKADKEAYDKLCKKYGAKYVNAYYKGIPIVGMPEGLLKGFCHKIYSQSGSSKTYYIYPWPTARDDQRVFTVYVYNGKVSRVIDRR